MYLCHEMHYHTEDGDFVQQNNVVIPERDSGRPI